MENAFRIIIVGGGPIGLLAAHCLSKAGLDFLLLERRDTLAPDCGASIGIYPSTFRIFDQLGLLPSLQKIWSPLRRKVVITHDGFLYKNHPRFEWMKANHGHPFAMVHRSELLSCLFDNLSNADKKRIHTGKQVVGIVTSPGGVEVRCSDGTTELGSIVIGSDGVHSAVRKYMPDNDQASSPLNPPLNPKQPYTASFRLLYGTARLLPNIQQETSWEAHGTGMSTQLFVGRDKLWFFCYEKLLSSTCDRATFSQADEEKLVEKWGDVHVTDEVQLKTLYAAKLSSGMTLVEEGIVDHWNYGRLVLVGDAAAKTTVNLAFGFNGGVQGLVALMNGLHDLTMPGASQNTEDIQNVFTHYQKTSMPLAKRFVAASGEMTHMSTWSSWKNWLMDRYVHNATNADYRTYHEKIGPILADSLVLNFLQERHLPESRMTWKHFPMLREPTSDEAKQSVE